MTTRRDRARFHASPVSGTDVKASPHARGASLTSAGVGACADINAVARILPRVSDGGAVPGHFGPIGPQLGN